MNDALLTEEQRMVRDMVRQFAREQVAPRSAAWEKAGWIDAAVVAQMGALGLLGLVLTLPPTVPSLSLTLPIGS